MTEAAQGSTVLAVRDLVVAFPGAAGRVVDSVGFDLRAGRVLALVGESGSGKSLTAMSVLGLQPGSAAVSGSIRLGGDELLGAPAAALRAVRGGRIGTVFQEPMSAFDPVYRIGDQIAEAIRVHAPGLGRGALRERVRALLAAVGLADPARIAGSFPHQLSGGQLQRAMIATAIANDPVALIADEPTTALDVTVQAGILDLLRSLAADRGTAVLLITHDMGVVADLADDVLVLRGGAVVESGTARSVLRDPQHPYTRELLASVPSLTAGPAGEAGGGAPVATLEHATVSYRRRGRTLLALDGVDLRIGAGEVVGLVGESGSGKSTAGRALIGLVPLAGGGASVDGVDLRRAGRRARRDVRARIGTVFQDPASSLNPRTTAGWSIAEPLLLHSDRTAQQRSERVTQLLEAVRLPASFADRYPHELSGGQRQRVAIARALALDPALLIADEPTSALDVSVQAAVLDLLADLQRRLGFACLLISHDLAVVRRLAGTVVVLRDGRVVEQGPTGRVLTDPADPYTRRLLAAVPVPDPEAQAARREQRRLLEVER